MMAYTPTADITCHATYLIYNLIKTLPRCFPYLPFSLAAVAQLAHPS